MSGETLERARGHWPHILAALGIDRKFLRNRHGPCPLCGGRDRYRFDDRNGNGDYYCGGCGPGVGITMVRKLHNWDFKTAADEIDRIIGGENPKNPTPPVNYEPAPANDRNPLTPEERLRRLKEVIAEAGDAELVAEYLGGRGLSIFPTVLCGHGCLPYRHDDRYYGRLPAMVAPILGPDGRLQSVHRTYLADDIPARKKIMLKVETIRGAAVRLFQPAHELGVGTGIETSIAARELFGIPTWALLADALMKTFVPPPGVRRLVIFGDNDASFSGQTASYDMAKRLGPDLDEVEVKIPPDVGTDWLDVLNQ